MPGKAAAQKLLVGLWVAGNKFHALPYILDKADTLCGACGQWGHSEFWCQRGVATCTICEDSHRTEEYRCQVAMCGKVGKVCPHTEMKCPNCGGRHLAQNARCMQSGPPSRLPGAGETAQFTRKQRSRRPQQQPAALVDQPG